MLLLQTSRDLQHGPDVPLHYSIEITPKSMVSCLKLGQWRN